MFSILILTKNEEINLAACLESVAWCDDVVVLDSFSDDRTLEIAQARRIPIQQRRFDNFGSQRNFALETIQFRHPWVFHLDADERFNGDLRAECERVIALDRHSAYFVPNRIIFLGRWIRYSSQYPYPQVRLLKIGEVKFRKSGHGQSEDAAVRGVGHIEVPYDHLNFSKGIRDWVEKHNRYSDEEARLSICLIGEQPTLSALFSSNGIERKRALKLRHARLPARWLFKFLYLYFVKMGLRDGYPGFVYCVLQGFYDFLISAKITEIRRADSGQLR